MWSRRQEDLLDFLFPLTRVTSLSKGGGYSKATFEFYNGFIEEGNMQLLFLHFLRANRKSSCSKFPQKTRVRLLPQFQEHTYSISKSFSGLLLGGLYFQGWCTCSVWRFILSVKARVKKITISDWQSQGDEISNRFSRSASVVWLSSFLSSMVSNLY